MTEKTEQALTIIYNRGSCTPETFARNMWPERRKMPSTTAAYLGKLRAMGLVELIDDNLWCLTKKGIEEWHQMRNQ